MNEAWNSLVSFSTHPVGADETTWLNTHTSVKVKDAISYIAGKKELSGLISSTSINEYRQTVEDFGKKSKAAKWEKNSFPAFIFQGLFPNSARISTISSVSGWLVVDVDSYDFKDVNVWESLKRKASTIEFIGAIWRSPSFGVKMLVLTDFDVLEPELHKYAYKIALRRIINVGILSESALAGLDSQTCNINRLCYHSYDPDVYSTVNVNVKPLLVKDEAIAEKNQRDSEQKAKLEQWNNRYGSAEINYDAQDRAAKKCAIKYSEVIGEGNRNDTLFLFARELAWYQLSDTEILDYIMDTDYGDRTKEHLMGVVHNAIEASQLSEPPTFIFKLNKDQKLASSIFKKKKTW